MKVQVMGVKKTGKDFNLVYVQLGGIFGTVIAIREVDKPGTYELKTTYRAEAGRIVPRIRVEKA